MFLTYLVKKKIVKLKQEKAITPTIAMSIAELNLSEKESPNQK